MEHKNNLHFIRLVFATFVVFSHSFFLLEQGDREWIRAFMHEDWLLSEIGVYGFFIISGGLVFRSLQNSTSILDYLEKRIRRIFPALLVVILLTTFVLGPLVSSVPVFQYFRADGTWKYFSSNVVLLPLHLTLPGVFVVDQMDTPVNGSLWTLRYELLFYFLLLGLLFFQKRSFRLISALLAVSLGVLYFLLQKYAEGLPPWFRHFRSFSILGFFFSYGMFLNEGLDVIKRHKRSLLAFATVFCLFSLLLGQAWIAFFLCFPIMVYSFGYMYFPSLSYHRVFGDVSYGIYIYSYPIQKTLISHFHISDPYHLFFVSLFLSFAFGYLSWQLVERPFLTKERRRWLRPAFRFQKR